MISCIYPLFLKKENYQDPVRRLYLKTKKVSAFHTPISPTTYSSNEIIIFFRKCLAMRPYAKEKFLLIKIYWNIRWIPLGSCMYSMWISYIIKYYSLITFLSKERAKEELDIYLDFFLASNIYKKVGLLSLVTQFGIKNIYYHR